MSTSSLYHCQGINGYTHIGFKYEEAKTSWKIKRNPKKERCPNCKSSLVTSRKIKERSILGLPTGSRQTIFIVVVIRIRCKECGADTQSPIDFADPYKSYSKSLARYAIELLKQMSIDAVAKHLKMSWGTIKEIQKEYLLKKYEHIPLKNVRYLGIDEIYVGYKKYMTVVLNMETGEVLFVGEGRDQDSLEPFMKKLNKSKAKIKAVAVDMSKAYTAWVKKCLPKARIVYDKFHVVKKMSEYVDSFRRDLQEQLDKEEKQYLKGSRWILLKNHENLKEEEKSRLKEILHVNQPLAVVYQLKEQLKTIWNQDTKREAGRAMKLWCSMAKESGIAQMKKMANLLESHKEGILAYYNAGHITSAKVEGFNNKIRWLIKIAYGYRDWEFFKLRVYHLPNAKVSFIA